MIELETLTTFFGWCSVINTSILLFTSLILILMGKNIANIHGRLFGIDNNKLFILYFQYLGNYKIAILILNISPYITLKLIS